MKETVLVFEDPVEDADLRQEKLSTVAWQQDWELCKIEKRSENNPLLKAWLTEDEATGITYIENHVVDIPYIIIRGENQEKIVEVLSKAFQFYKTSDLQSFIHSNPEDDRELARVIYLFGIAVERESFNANSFTTFEYCLTHPVPNVRRAAMHAVGGIGWQEFQPILENIRASDPDLELRGFANTTLEAMQTYHWSPKAS